MDISRIGKLTTIEIDLNDITNAEVADHLPQFSDVIATILEKVLADTAGPNETVKVDILTAEQMSIEAEMLKHPGDEPSSTQGKLLISVTQEFPLPRA